MDEGSAAASQFPDWCDPSPWLWAYVCEQYVASPIWCTVFVIDGIALWIIAAILLRQREQEREAKAARLALPRAARARRDWRVVAAVARLATLAAGGSRDAGWPRLWEKASHMRRDRRQYLARRDFHLAGVYSRAAGPLLLLGCTLLIWFEVNSYLAVGLPGLGLGPSARCAGQFFGWVVGLRIGLDYARTAFTNPGQPEAEASKASRAASGVLSDLELGEQTGREARRCKHCLAAKPPRCHHCKVCRRCVLKMDHHCPFVNNCVGLRNYRYFIFFLADLVAGCLMVALSLFPQVPGIVLGHSSETTTLARRVHVIVAFVVAVVAAGALVPFLLFHVQLILLNKTSLELLGRRPPPRRAAAAAAAPGRALSAAEGGGAGAGGAGLANLEEVCWRTPEACRPCVEGLLKRLVPPGMAHLAKRSE